MAKVSSSTRVLGLVGNPVEDSLSPELQNWAIDRLGLDYRYFAFPVKRDGLKRAIVGAKELGVKGLNVTVPHKKAAGELVDRLSRSATIVGAVNTIIFNENGSLKGDNTDWKGFVESLELDGFDPKGKNCLVFGAGGAASGVVFGLARSGVESIVIVNRTEAKGVDIAKNMRGLSPGVDLAVRPLSGSDIGKKVERSDLVVNATSVGMGCTAGDTIWEKRENFHSGQLVYDLVYNPSPTRFLELAGGAGARTLDGLDMLILQGLESLKKWTGEEFESGEMVGELRRYLRQ